MALTLSSGMDTYSSLDMVAALVGNEKMKQKILSCKEAINAGANFAEALTVPAFSTTCIPRWYLSVSAAVT